MSSLLWALSELGGRKPLVLLVGRSSPLTMTATCLEVDGVVLWEENSNVRGGRVEREMFLNLCDAWHTLGKEKASSLG